MYPPGIGMICVLSNTDLGSTRFHHVSLKGTAYILRAYAWFLSVIFYLVFSDCDGPTAS